jgi:hypothetical protein
MLFKDRVCELEGHLRLADTSESDDGDLLTVLLNDKLSLERINLFCSTGEVFVFGEGQVHRRLDRLACKDISLKRLRLRPDNWSMWEEHVNKDCRRENSLTPS